MILWLIGMMGAGKTSAGRLVASELDIGFVDVDEWVEEKSGRTIADIWESLGETEFRILESEAISAIVEARGGPGDPDLIAAAGGGSILQPGNVTAMKSSGVLVWLDAAPETAAARIGNDHGRPLVDSVADPSTALARLSEERRSRYADASNYRVAVDQLGVVEVAEAVRELWNRL